MAKLTKETRDALPDSDFAVPRKRALPIHDADHTRMAWNEVGKAKDLSAVERKEARGRIMARAETLGVNTAKWGRLNAPVTLSAMALNISNDGHPNKMPFSGILTRIDQPSDAPPGGSGGKLITISAEAAEKGLSSLLGMAVNFTADFDGHDPKAKVGVITAATIEDDAILIEGFIYAADFPEVAAEIKASKEFLGLSFEARNLYTNDPDANPVVIIECVFTGAAILRKDKAAYRTTALAANADKGILDMDAEELKKLMGDIIKPVTDQLATVSASVTKLEADRVKGAELTAKVEPLALALEASATTLEASGVNAAHLREQAAHMRQEAAAGRMPTAIAAAAAKPAKTEDTGNADSIKAAVEAATKPLLDSVAAMGTQIKDLQAKGVSGGTPPERKTLSPTVTALLAKAGLTPPTGDGEKIAISKIDDALKGLSVEQRLQAKTGLRQAGVID